jgi:hypothetical protein
MHTQLSISPSAFSALRALLGSVAVSRRGFFPGLYLKSLASQVDIGFIAPAFYLDPQFMIFTVIGQVPDLLRKAGGKILDQVVILTAHTAPYFFQ